MAAAFLSPELEVRGFLKVFDPQTARWFDQPEDGAAAPPPALSPEDEKEAENQENAANPVMEAMRRELEQIESETKKIRVQQLMKTLEIAEMRKEAKGVYEKLKIRGVKTSQLNQAMMNIDEEQEGKKNLCRAGGPGACLRIRLNLNHQYTYQYLNFQFEFLSFIKNLACSRCQFQLLFYFLFLRKVGWLAFEIIWLFQL